MDPRWGARGKWIKFTIDVDFLTSDGRKASISSSDVAECMVKDNFTAWRFFRYIEVATQTDKDFVILLHHSSI
eukprot:11520343-Ditylum_brightwellii.AAC.1